MNAFAQAHKLTKEIIQPGDNYAATFALCLKHLNQKVNPMIDMIDGMIADSQAYIARLEAFKATNPTGYMVITGKLRVCVKFEGDTAGWATVQTATRYNDLRIAQAKARQVQNGANEKGQAVYVVDQIEWEVNQQNKLIADLTEAKKNHK